MAVSRAKIFGDMWEATMDALVKVAENVPEEKRLRALQPGKSHPLWLIGHLANTDNLLVNMWCCERDSLLPKHYAKIFAPDFAGGDPIETDPGKYPSWDEVVDGYKTVMRSSLDGIRALPDEYFDGPLRGGAPENMQERFSPIQKCIQTMLSHEAHHRGQIAMLAALD